MSSEHIKRVVEKIGHPAIVLKCQNPIGEMLPEASRLGGKPYLPDGFKWPLYPPTSEPLAFVGQLNFADITNQLVSQFNLPDRGLLQYFCHYPFLDDSQDEHFVAWHPSIDSGQWALYEDASIISFTTLLLQPEAGVSFVDRDTVSAVHSFDANDLDRFYQRQRSHQLCGIPKPIQYDPFELFLSPETGWLTNLFKTKKQEESQKIAQLAAQEWQLLWQIDSDPLIGLNWIDGGIVYLLIKTKDLQAGNFSNLYYDLQTY